VAGAYTITGAPGPVVAIALHAGHEVRAEVAAAIGIDEATRLREEDPGTDRLTHVAPLRVVVHRSRFEIDLNRPREGAVYRTPEQAWGLEVWSRPPTDDLCARSLAIYDAFYADLAARLDEVAAAGPFAVLDLHSYNHRRDGADRPASPAEDNPEVNVGTGSMDRRVWGPMVDRFIADLGGQDVAGHRLDVRENVRFRGGHLARWAHDRYPGRAGVLAVELKKAFMDEWTGEIDGHHLDGLGVALAATMPGLVDALPVGGHR
jgi:N-formylglutamate deformylase